MRGTWPSTLACASPTSNSHPLGKGFGPARADCGFREPLAPRLARPGRVMVPARFAAKLTLPGAHSSAGERPLHTREVGGSIPPVPTTKGPESGAFLFLERQRIADLQAALQAAGLLRGNVQAHRQR